MLKPTQDVQYFSKQTVSNGFFEALCALKKNPRALQGASSAQGQRVSTCIIKHTRIKQKRKKKRILLNKQGHQHACVLSWYLVAVVLEFVSNAAFNNKKTRILFRLLTIMSREEWAYCLLNCDPVAKFNILLELFLNMPKTSLLWYQSRFRNKSLCCMIFVANRSHNVLATGGNISVRWNNLF